MAVAFESKNLMALAVGVCQDNGEKAFEYECKRGMSFENAVKSSKNVKKCLNEKYPTHDIHLKIVGKKIGNHPI